MILKGQTCTAVHSRQAALGQRQGEALRNHFSLSAILLYAQLVIGCGFVLYEQVGTPGYMSILLLLLPMTLLYFISCRLAEKPGIREGMAGKAANVLLFACLIIDAQLSLYAFTAIVREILPDYNTALITFVTLLCVLPALRRQHSHALPSFGRLLRYPLLLGLGISMLGAMRYGRMDHLFPLLGGGVESILSGAVWMSTALSAALTPLMIHTPPSGRLQKRQGYRSLVYGLLLGAATAGVAAFLMPYHFLTLPDALGARLLMPVKVHPALISWSVTVCLMMLLMLISLSASLSRGLHLLSHVIGRPVGPWLAFLLVPLPALSTDVARQIVIYMPGFRLVCIAGTVILLGLGCLGKKGAGKK